jgi:hypothetical protein
MVARIVDVTTSRGLTAVQFTTSACDTFDYITGAKAIKKKLLEVREFTEAGSVNNLIVLNQSDEFVFLMDGDILVGAKQNRVLNTSVLLAPKSKTQIPVSCIEQGRWNYVSAKFDNPDYAAPHALRSLKAEAVRVSLRHNKTFSADQGEVWRRVGEYEHTHKHHSRTGNLSELYSYKQPTIDEILKIFNTKEGANGTAIYRGKNFCGMDIFNRADVCKEYFPKLIQGVALDLSPNDEKNPMERAEAEYRTVELMDLVETAEKQTFNAVGVGVERRFELSNASGFSLEFESKGIHTAVLQKEGMAKRRS